MANPFTSEPGKYLFKIQGHVKSERLEHPECCNEDGNPTCIVAKRGQSTDLTFGRYSPLEAYTCDISGNESWEIAIFNHGHKSRDFSAEGDSGSLVFNAQGEMVGIVHSAMTSGHITFATPAHFVIEQIKSRYPYADFERVEF
jgi:hypothetical protein